MFDHVTIRVSDRAASEPFYRTVLGTLGIEPSQDGEEFLEWNDFSLAQASEGHPPTRNLHVAFVAGARELVDEFWRAGVEAGFRDDGKPGVRKQYMPDYYGAFLLDPDGNSVEAVHHDDTRRGGHIDHLWLRVRDLDAAERFYRTIARYTGIYGTGRHEWGSQLRGAWATMSLIDDEKPPTENLHIAFPAPDLRTVAEFHAAASAAGYRSNGEPGERPEYHPGYYGAFVLDPDGTNVESVFRDRR